jgi:hypothetical protein
LFFVFLEEEANLHKSMHRDLLLKKNLNSKKTKQVFLFFLLLLYCYYHTKSQGHDIHFKNVIKTSRSLMFVLCGYRKVIENIKAQTNT